MDWKILYEGWFVLSKYLYCSHTRIVLKALAIQISLNVTIHWEQQLLELHFVLDVQMEILIGLYFIL